MDDNYEFYGLISRAVLGETHTFLAHRAPFATTRCEHAPRPVHATVVRRLPHWGAGTVRTEHPMGFVHRSPLPRQPHRTIIRTETSKRFWTDVITSSMVSFHGSCWEKPTRSLPTAQGKRPHGGHRASGIVYGRTVPAHTKAHPRSRRSPCAPLGAPGRCTRRPPPFKFSFFPLGKSVCANQSNYTRLREALLSEFNSHSPISREKVLAILDSHSHGPCETSTNTWRKRGNGDG